MEESKNLYFYAALLFLVALRLIRRLFFMGNTLEGLVYRLERNDAELVELRCEHEGLAAIGDEGAAAVAAALAGNTHLETLDLGGMEIGDAGAERIASVLYLNTTLSLLRLHKNKVGDHGAKALATALRHNHTVTTCYLEMSNPLRNKQINDEIQDLISINRQAGSPDEAYKRKAALFGAELIAQGQQLRQRAEEEIAKYKAEQEPSSAAASDTASETAAAGKHDKSE